MEQLSLMDPEDYSDPRCQKCDRPARRRLKGKVYSKYCGGDRCENRHRTCHWCKHPFVLGAPGAGSKYCSTKCKVEGYHPAGTNVTRCAWCDRIARGISRKWSERFIWPYICSPCLEPLSGVVGTLRDHRVPHERARRLLVDAGCEICGIDLLERVKIAGGKTRAWLAVDHDHACCPQIHSCGKCIRGLICRNCNAAAGMLRDRPANARALAAYLDAWLEREVRP